MFGDVWFIYVGLQSVAISLDSKFKKERLIMANSKIGQWQLEYRIDGFTNPVRSHSLRVWVSASGTPTVGQAPADIQIQKRGGATATLQAVADQCWGFLRLFYTNTLSASSFSLWRYATETRRDFYSGGSLTTPAGSVAGLPTPAHQVTLTFRHALGGIGKLVLLETSLSGDSRLALVANAAGNPAQRMAAYMMSADGIMVALDNSFPISPLRDSRGQNETIWKQLYRSGN